MVAGRIKVTQSAESSAVKSLVENGFHTKIICRWMFIPPKCDMETYGIYGQFDPSVFFSSWLAARKPTRPVCSSMANSRYISSSFSFRTLQFGAFFPWCCHLVALVVSFPHEKWGHDVGNRQCHNYHLGKWSRSLDRPSMVIMVKVIGDVREKSNMETENRVWRMCLLLKIACFRCYFCCLNLILLWFWYPYMTYVSSKIHRFCQ